MELDFLVGARIGEQQRKGVRSSHHHRVQAHPNLRPGRLVPNDWSLKRETLVHLSRLGPSAHFAALLALVYAGIGYALNMGVSLLRKVWRPSL